MKIILDTTSSNEHYNADCDCAVVELTPVLVEQIRSRAELAGQALKQDGDLYEMYFWGGEARFYDINLVNACEDAAARAVQGTDEDQTTAAQNMVERTGEQPICSAAGRRRS